LAWVLVGAVVGLTVAGARHPTVALGAIAPVAAVTPTPVADADSLEMPDEPMPHDPTAWRRFPSLLSASTQMQPIPSFVGVDDPPEVGPPPPIDPAVAQLLATLRQEAKGTPSDLRPGVQALAALDFALAQVGRPYVWGAIGPESYDCSGLTWRSYETAGVTLPRVSADQHASGGPPVAIAALLPGDLVFFATAAWDPGAVHHVGMYVGRGLMVNAPHPGAYVRVEPVTAAGYVGAVRVVPARPAPVAPTVSPTPSASAKPTTGTTQPSVSPSPTEATPTDAPTDTPTPTPSATDPTTDPTDPTTDPPTDPATDPATETPSELVTGG
jgi:hypothetical protein